MDVTFFRVMLVISGAVLIVGIYLSEWLKNKLQQQTKAMLRQRRVEKDDEIEAFSIKADDRSSTGFELPMMKGERNSLTESKLPQEQEKVIAGPEADNAVLGVIQFSVIATKGKKLYGDDLDSSLVNLGLKFGEMGIYHCQFDSGDLDCFNVANRVEPGSFPMDRLKDFSTDGVVFFMQPINQNDALAVFEKMVESSQKLAKKLDGILLDENQCLLDETVISNIRKLLLKR